MTFVLEEKLHSPTGAAVLKVGALDSNIGLVQELVGMHVPGLSPRAAESETGWRPAHGLGSRPEGLDARESWEPWSREMAGPPRVPFHPPGNSCTDSQG